MNPRFAAEPQAALESERKSAVGSVAAGAVIRPDRVAMLVQGDEQRYDVGNLERFYAKNWFEMMPPSLQHQPDRVHQKVPFAAVYLLCAVVAADPPCMFSEAGKLGR